ncbi:MAG: hypothetical protein NVS4B8_21530 [Herpetosiphon sp.]
MPFASAESDGICAHSDERGCQRDGVLLIAGMGISLQRAVLDAQLVATHLEPG